MNLNGEQTSEFERRTRVVLDESVAHTDARIRSRLNRARQAALVAAAPPSATYPRKIVWKIHGLMPVTGALAAALVLAVVLGGRYIHHALPVDTGQGNAFEDIDLIADDEALNLMEEGDRSFYEWAVAQDDGTEGTST